MPYRSYRVIVKGKGGHTIIMAQSAQEAREHLREAIAAGNEATVYASDGQATSEAALDALIKKAIH